MLNSDPTRHPEARGAEAEAIMRREINEPIDVDLLGMRVLYDPRLVAGMTEGEARPIVLEILSRMRAGH